MTGKFHRPASAEDFVRGANEPVAPLMPVKAKPEPAAAKVDPAPAEAAPWDSAREDVAVYTNFKMSQVTHAKMVWVTDNVPKMKSMQKIIDAAVLPMLERLIAEHYGK